MGKDAGPMTWLCLTMATLSLVGCGTSFGMNLPPAQLRAQLDTNSKVYVGVRVDSHAFVSYPTELAKSNNPIVWLLYTLVEIYLVVDLPISFVADTLLLPFTLSSGPDSSKPNPHDDKGTGEHH